MRLILASASPRRAELLTAAGFAFEACVTDIDEQVRAAELPRDYVRRLAVEKSARALELMSDGACVVIGADTTVMIDEEILGKPLDVADSERMLRRIAGRRHTVMTGVSVRTRQRELAQVVETAVFVDPLNDEEIRWYVGTGEGMDKAGAYAIQGLASRFISRIEGSYSNVVGLPVGTVYRLLAQLRTCSV